MVAVLVIASITVHRASAATIATDVTSDPPAAAAVATAEGTPIFTRTTIATTPPATTSASSSTTPTYEAEAPHEVMLGRFMIEPYSVSSATGRNNGFRFGTDMMAAVGDGPTRMVGGLRFFLGGDGASRFGTEGQLQIGVAHMIRDRAAVALVAPLGFSLGGGHDHFEPHGYAGIEGVAAIGRFAREQGPGVRGIEMAAGIYNRGRRARIGWAFPGRSGGVGIGVDWQREDDAELIGIYIASVPGR